MAAALVRSRVQFSALRQPLVDIVRRGATKSYISQGFPGICIQCQCYHATPTYLKQRKSGEEKKAQPSTFRIAKNAAPLIEVWRGMSIMDLACSAQRNVSEVLEAIRLIDRDNRYNKNTVIAEPSTVYEVVKKLGGKPKQVAKPENSSNVDEQDCDVVRCPPPDESVLERRHPVVTVMGHVDHGKTTLLDALRNTSVVDTEFGGITQHIGAFNVVLQSGERVTFLDTPGHAAFSAMRARGAHATDIVVLVVAADDGVMEQTIQSIEMAKDANVPIIVAINKIDKPEANIKRTQNMLAQQGILVEDLGGDVQSINISALKKTNLDILTEAIVLQAELMNLKGDPKGLVEGIVIECTNHPGRGKLATALIQRGTLKKGTILVSGLAWAKVRAMFDHAGNPVPVGKISDPVQIIGWRSLPEAGDEILEVESEKKANIVVHYRERKKLEMLALEHKDAADKRLEEHLIEYKEKLQQRRKARVRKLRPTGVRTREVDPLAHIPKLNIIIKGDVLGSVEAMLDIIDTYEEDDRCRLSVVHYGVGPVTDTDLELAEVFNAIIYRFNVDVPKKLKEEAEAKCLPIRLHRIIYKFVDDLKEEINKKLPSVEVEHVIGQAEVLQEFRITDGKKKVNVAGCRCTSGVLKKSAMYHLIRGNETIYTGMAVSMRHLKEEVQSVKNNTECGLKLDDPSVTFKRGDILICFNKVQEPQSTNWNPGF